MSDEQPGCGGDQGQPQGREKGSPEGREVSRRRFLKYTGATTLGLPFLSSCATQGDQGTSAGAGEPGPNYAFIGTAGRARAHVSKIATLGGNCPCFCDVDRRRQKPAGSRWPNANAYQDYRRMYDEMADEIDAVFVCTPDHHHFPASYMALQRGIHVYCEKPLTWSPWEARKLQEKAEREQLVTQMGNQRHGRWQKVVNLLRSGIIGDIEETHSWTDRPIWPQGMQYPEQTDPVPGALDWDVWLGPAEKRPFTKNAYHPFKWRAWYEYGAGALGDMACHIMDGMFWAQNAKVPEDVELVTVDNVSDDAFPAMSTVRWAFPEKDGRPAFEAYWYDGNPPEYRNKPERPEGFSEPDWKKAGNGNLFIGTRGMLYASAYGNLKKIVPDERAEKAGQVKTSYVTEPDPGHHKEFILPVRGDKPWDYPSSSFSYAAPMTETILLGVLAQRRMDVGKTLKYDPESGTFTNDEKINRWLRREYRDGWDVV